MGYALISVRSGFDLSHILLVGLPEAVLFILSDSNKDDPSAYGDLDHLSTRIRNRNFSQKLRLESITPLCVYTGL